MQEKISLKKHKKCIALCMILLLSTFPLSGLANNMDTKSIKYSDIINLSHSISEKIPLWPGDPPVEFETVATLKKDGYFLRRFSIGEHSATHMNAPNSFHKDSAGIEDYKPESLVRSAVVIDVRKQSSKNPDYVINTNDVTEWERKHGRIPPGTIALFYTGWQERWNTPTAFLNADANGNLHFPGIGIETTRFLLENRQIAGVGIDTHGVDPGLDEKYGTNKQVLANKGIILECLTNIDRLPARGTTLVIGLLRLEGGSGSPVSVLAFIP